MADGKKLRAARMDSPTIRQLSPPARYRPGASLAVTIYGEFSIRWLGEIQAIPDASRAKKA